MHAWYSTYAGSSSVTDPTFHREVNKEILNATRWDEIINLYPTQRSSGLPVPRPNLSCSAYVTQSLGLSICAWCKHSYVISHLFYGFQISNLDSWSCRSDCRSKSNFAIVCPSPSDFDVGQRRPTLRRCVKIATYRPWDLSTPEFSNPLFSEWLEASLPDVQHVANDKNDRGNCPAHRYFGSPIASLCLVIETRSWRAWWRSVDGLLDLLLQPIFRYTGKTWWNCVYTTYQSSIEENLSSYLLQTTTFDF